MVSLPSPSSSSSSLSASAPAAAAGNSPNVTEADRVRTLQQQQIEWMKLQQQISKQQQEVSFRVSQQQQQQQQQQQNQVRSSDRRQGDRATPEHQRLENPELRTPPRKLQRADMSLATSVVSPRHALSGLGGTHGSFVAGGGGMSARRPVPIPPLGLQLGPAALSMAGDGGGAAHHQQQRERRFSESMIDEQQSHFLLTQPLGMHDTAAAADVASPSRLQLVKPSVSTRSATAAAASQGMHPMDFTTLPEAPASVVMQRHHSEPAGGVSRSNGSSRDNSRDNSARCLESNSARDDEYQEGLRRPTSPPARVSLSLGAVTSATGGPGPLGSPLGLEQPSRLRSWSEPAAPTNDLMLLMSAPSSSRAFAAAATQPTASALEQVDEMDAEEAPFGVAPVSSMLAEGIQPSSSGSRVLPASILLPESTRPPMHSGTSLFTPLLSSSPVATLFTPSPLPSMSPPAQAQASVLPHSTTPPVSIGLPGSNNGGCSGLTINLHAHSLLSNQQQPANTSSFALLASSPSAFLAPFSPLPLQLQSNTSGSGSFSSNANAAPSPGFTTLFPSMHVGMTTPSSSTMPLLSSTAATTTAASSSTSSSMNSLQVPQQLQAQTSNGSNSSSNHLSHLRVPGPGSLFLLGSPLPLVSPLPLDSELLKQMMS
jgi:hypothetical protein